MSSPPKGHGRWGIGVGESPALGDCPHLRSHTSIPSSFQASAHVIILICDFEADPHNPPHKGDVRALGVVLENRVRVLKEEVQEEMQPKLAAGMRHT